MSGVLIKDTARNLMVLMVQSSDHVTGLASLTLTITASKNGAAFASITPTVTDRGSGWYSLALTSSHTDTAGDLCLHITGTSADPLDLRFSVELEGVKPTTAGRTLDISAGGEAGVDWANVGSPTTTLNLSGTTVKTATDVETATTAIKNRIPLALTAGGNIKADVYAMQADTVTSSSLAASAVTKIAAGLPTAAGIVDAVFDENVAAHLAGGSFGEWLDETQSAIGTISGIAFRLLGLSNENARIDQTTYSGGKCTAMRIRVFADAAAANASTAGAADGTESEVHRYTVAASYTGDELDSYKMVRAL